MVSSAELDNMFVAGIIIHLASFLVFGYLSVGDTSDSAKRRSCMWSALAHVALFTSYIFLKCDAGIRVRIDNELFAQPFWIAMIVWSVLTSINVGIIERLSKANGLMYVAYTGAATYMFFLAGRQDERKPRDAMYAMAWFVFVLSTVTAVFASRLRRMAWVGPMGNKYSVLLPFTRLERFLQHLSTFVFVVIILIGGIVLGLSPAIGGKISYSNQYIGYLTCSGVSFGLSFLQYIGHREIGLPDKNE